jgi:N6-L-threonylcarbamoyladenine synthase
VEDYKNTGKKLPVEDVAASFQQAVVDALYEKTIAAAEEYKAKDIIVAGGVSANRPLREAFRSQTRFRVHIPHMKLCTDNAAMIATAAFRHLVIGQTDQLDFDVQPNWPLVAREKDK